MRNYNLIKYVLLTVFLFLVNGFIQKVFAQSRIIKDVAYLGANRNEKLDIYLPERESADPSSPGIVWIHGGGWIGGTKNEARAANICGALAKRGYVCVSIDYKLGDGAWPTNLFDCKNAVRFLRAHASEYNVDPDRIAVMGGSAGGHLALMVGLTTSDKQLEPTEPYPQISDSVSVIVDLYGPADLINRQAVDSEGNLLGHLDDDTKSYKVLGSRRAANPKLWSEASPVNHVTSDSPPVLIIQGTSDPLVDYHQSIELNDVLSKSGVPHQLLLIKGIGHQFDFNTWKGKPMPMDLAPLVANFLRQYFGTAAHGIPPLKTEITPRQSIDLNGDWKFYLADNVHGPQTGFDDSSWKTVTVPHTWNNLDGEDGGSNYHRGVAWYRRHVKLDRGLTGKRFYLQFEGVSLAAEVYVNGVHIGGHKGGFSRFSLDATESLIVGQDNLISVCVDNGKIGIPPTSADFTFFGGIYRGVNLLVTNQIQISATDYGSAGVYLDQTKVTNDEADLTVRTQVESYSDKNKQVEVHSYLIDKQGVVIATAGNMGMLNTGDGVEERQLLHVLHPHLWNGREDPYLYTLRVDIVADKVVVDSLTQSVGLRYFKVDPNLGFFLNGKHLDLYGVNRHQDRIDKGWAISKADEAEDFDLVNELGCTAIRISHYQQSSTWYDRCDKTGIVAWAEFPFVGEALPTPEFLENAKQQLRELVRQNYNHPAVCFWGVGNETRGTKSDKIISELATVVKAQDSSRLSTYASDERQSVKNWHTDLVDFNYYAGWYKGQMSDLPKMLDDMHGLHPATSFGLSEFGAGASILQHQDPVYQPVAKARFHPEEYQAKLHEYYWQVLKDRPYVWSKFIWCMFDFASDGRNEGDQPGRNDKGLVTYDRRIRKDAFYWYKSNWSLEPVVWINSRRFLERKKELTDVKVYSNAPELELFLEGKSLGVKKSQTHIFVWPSVKLNSGENHFSATAHFGALDFSDACTWLYSPAPPQKTS
jgi:beta-galactosidase